MSALSSEVVDRMVNIDERLKRWLTILAFAVGGYLMASAATAGLGSGILPALPLPSWPEIALPDMSIPTMSGESTVIAGILGLAVVYGLATKRGWREDVRFLVQLGAISLMGYLLGMWVGPMVWGVIPA